MLRSEYIEGLVISRLILIGFSFKELLVIFGIVFGLVGLFILILHAHHNHTRRKDVTNAFLRRFWKECDTHGMEAACDCGLCRALKGERAFLLEHLSEAIYEIDLEHEDMRRQQFDYDYKASRSAAKNEAHKIMYRPEFLKSLQTAVHHERSLRTKGRR